MKINTLVLVMTLCSCAAGPAHEPNHATVIVCSQLTVLNALVETALHELGADPKYALALRVVFAGASVACAGEGATLPPAPVTGGGL